MVQSDNATEPYVHHGRPNRVGVVLQRVRGLWIYEGALSFVTDIRCTYR